MTSKNKTKRKRPTPAIAQALEASNEAVARLAAPAFVEHGWPREEAEALFQCPTPAGPPELYAGQLQLGMLGHWTTGSLSSHPPVTDPSYWQEANALVAFSLRNGPLLEGLHAREDGITDLEMRALMIFTARRLAYLLWARDQLPHTYRQFLANYLKLEPGRWVDNDEDAEEFVVLDYEKDPIDTQPDEIIHDAPFRR